MKINTGLPDENGLLIGDEPSTPRRAVSSRVTPLEFMERFTEAEQAAILAAAQTDPAVRVYWEKMKLAGSLRLDDPRAVAGVQALEAAGLIAVGRADEILAI